LGAQVGIEITVNPDSMEQEASFVFLDGTVDPRFNGQALPGDEWSDAERWVQFVFEEDRQADWRSREMHPLWYAVCREYFAPVPRRSIVKRMLPLGVLLGLVACTPQVVPGSLDDGEELLSEQPTAAFVPYAERQPSPKPRPVEVEDQRPDEGPVFGEAPSARLVRPRFKVMRSWMNWGHRGYEAWVSGMNRCPSWVGVRAIPAISTDGSTLVHGFAFDTWYPPSSSPSSSRTGPSSFLPSPPGSSRSCVPPRPIDSRG
jgi:hypothetical protein